MYVNRKSSLPTNTIPRSSKQTHGLAKHMTKDELNAGFVFAAAQGTPGGQILKIFKP